MALFLGVLLVFVVTARATGGRLLRLADLRFRKSWLLFGAFLIQFLLFKVFSHHRHDIQPVLYLASYGMGGAFLWANRKVNGLWLIGLGALFNGLAIAANGGIMPGSESAFIAAHLTPAPSEFVNSRALVDPRLLFLGDVFAVPTWLPIHNVFSIGDVCILVGAFVLLHRAVGSRLLPSGTGQFAGLAKERNFIRLWGAQAVSNQGDWVYTLGVVASLARRGLGAETLAMLVVMQAAPRAITSALGGPFIDRFSRGKIMVAADVVRAAAVLSLLLRPDPTIGHLYAVAACLGLCAALFQPSLQASIPNVVPAERLVAANALVSATFQLAIMVGPLLGALLVSQVGLRPAFAINAGSFILSALLVAGVKLPAHERRTTSPRAELVEGFRFAVSTPVVRGILLVTGLIMFAAAIRNPLEPLFVLRVLDADAGALGLPPAVWGLGMLLGSTAAPALARRWSCERMLVFSVALVGMMVLSASRSAMLSSLLGLWLLAGSGNALGTIAYQSLLQDNTPDRLRGRIVAASETVLDAAYLAGVTLAGWMGSHVGLRTALAVAGMCFIAAAVVGRVVLGTGKHPPTAAISTTPGVVEIALVGGKRGQGRTPSDPRAQAAFAKLRGEAPVAAPIATVRLVQIDVVGLAQDGGRLLHCPPGPGQAALVHRQLGAARVDGLLQPRDGQVGQLLGDGLQPAPDLVELTGHGSPRR